MHLVRNRKFGSAALICALCTAQAAHGLTFDFGAPFGTPADAALARAAAQWTSRISDPILVTVDVSFDTFDPNIIGQASTVTLTTFNGFETARSALIDDAASEPDDAIVAALPTLGQFASSVIMPATNTYDNEILGAKAAFKAMGFAGFDGDFGAGDGTIQFNDAFSFDFDNSDGVTLTETDFETVAAHEIGHILGFQSAVDLIDQGVVGPIGVFRLDLFRFGVGNEPTSATDFTMTGRELRPGAEASFGDTNNNFRLSTGRFTGDGRQASHFKDDSLLGMHLGVMDPTLASSVLFDMTEADLRMLDLIGWDIAPIPLPPAALLLGSACGMLACLSRKRRSAVSRIALRFIQATVD